MDKTIVKNGQSQTADFSGYRFWKEGDDLPDFPVPLAKRPDHWLKNDREMQEHQSSVVSLRPTESKSEEKPVPDNNHQSSRPLENSSEAQASTSSINNEQENIEAVRRSDVRDQKIDDVAQAFENARHAEEEEKKEHDWTLSQPALRVYQVSDAEESAESHVDPITGKEFYAVALAHVVGPLTEMVNQTFMRYGHSPQADEDRLIIEKLVKQVIALAECIEKNITMEGEWVQSVSWRFVRAARHVVQNGYNLRYAPMDEDFFTRVCDRVSDLSGHVLCLTPDHLDEQEFSLHDRIDLFEALSPLAVPIEWYSFGHSSFDLIKKTGRELLARTKDFCQEMLSKGSACHKLEILKRFSVLYGECHLMEMNRLGHMSPEEQMAYGSLYGDTLPLSPVWTSFSQKIHLLTKQSIRLSEYAGKNVKIRKVEG